MRLPLAALGGGLLISFAGIFFVLSEANPVTGTFFRAAYALPILVVLYLIRRQRDQRPIKARWLALGAGLMLGADLTAWNAAIDRIGAGLATLIVNTQVIFVALGAWLAFGERPRRETAFAIPVILIGIALVSGVGQAGAFGENPLVGTAFALLGAVFYATFILAFRESNKSQAPGSGPLLEATIGVAILALAVGVPTSNIDFQFSWPQHGWLIAMAIGSQIVGWLLIGYALPRLPAAETATIILLQPAMTLVWGVLILDERPSSLQIVGAAVVLLGVGYVAFTKARPLPTPPLATQQQNQ